MSNKLGFYLHSSQDKHDLWSKIGRVKPPVILIRMDTKMKSHRLCCGELPAEARFVLGDLHYNAPNVQELCDQAERILVTTQYDPYPHTGDGVAVRRMFHKLRSTAIEKFNEQFKGIFDGHGQVPTKGLHNAQRFALGAILLYQLVLLYRFQHDQPLRIGLKAFLKAA